MVYKSQIRPNTGSRKRSKRIGRGNAGSGGTYAGKGLKGQKARSGNVHTLFEGGQSPLHLRLPKLRGFKRTLKRPYIVLNLDDLERLSSHGELTSTVLHENGVTVSSKEKLKILGGGSISSAVIIHTHAASKSAIEAIQSVGGTVVLPEELPPATRKKSKKNIKTKTKSAPSDMN